MTTLDARVLIVGGTGGIGRALAERYASLGSDVVITSRDAGRAAAIAAEIGPEHESEEYLDERIVERDRAGYVPSASEVARIEASREGRRRARRHAPTSAWEV